MSQVINACTVASFIVGAKGLLGLRDRRRLRDITLQLILAALRRLAASLSLLAIEHLCSRDSLEILVDAIRTVC